MTRHAAPQTSKTRAAIYCRISKDDAGTALGVKRQEKLCRQLAVDHDLDVVAVHVDNDVSAYDRRSKRPGLDGVLSSVERGEVDVLICYHVDRLYRRVVELESLVNLVERTGVGVLAVAAGKIDLSTASGQMIARILASVAQGEAARMGERIRAKQADLAAAGRPHGPRSYGYDAEWQIVPEEAATIRLAAQLVLDGESVLSVARELNARGIPSPKGGTWASPTVHRLLKSPTIAGLRVYRGEIVGEALWGGVLDRQTWDQVHAALSDPVRRRTRSTDYILSGLLRGSTGEPCGGGRRVRRGVVQRKYQTSAVADRYVRSRPETPVAWVCVDADEIERLVVEAVLTRADRSKLSTTSTDASAFELIEQLEAERVQLAQLKGEGAISMSEWLAARKPLEARLAAAKAAAPRALTNGVHADATLRARWPKLSDAQRKSVLRELIESITVEGQGRKLARNVAPLAERVTIKWRA